MKALTYIEHGKFELIDKEKPQIANSRTVSGQREHDPGSKKQCESIALFACSPRRRNCRRSYGF